MRGYTNQKVLWVTETVVESVMQRVLGLRGRMNRVVCANPRKVIWDSNAIFATIILKVVRVSIDISGKTMMDILQWNQS